MASALDANLDDINKTSFYIPYKPEEDSDTEETLDNPDAISFAEHAADLEEGRELRFLAYTEAWRKCLERMQETIVNLRRQTVDAVVGEVQSSYSHVLPGLPYSELPVISLTNSAFGSMFLEDVAQKLTTPHEEDKQPESFMLHLHPSDFPNITTGMRSIISGFVKVLDTEGAARGKPATSMANYDIKVLVACYKWFTAKHDTEDLPPPNLVLILHDFEQFDPTVMQDVFYICSQHVHHLPTVFLLAMSSPSTNYLHTAYPRSTLALLRGSRFSTLSGRKILEEVVLKTYYDAHFEPDLVIGPGVLEYLVDYFSRYNSQVDVIFTFIQLAHLHHFNADPISAMCHSIPTTEILSRASSGPFLEALRSRMAYGAPSTQRKSPNKSKAVKPSPSVDQVIAAVRDARKEFFSRAQKLRIGFNLLLKFQQFLESKSYKGLEWKLNVEKSGGILEVILKLMNEGFDRDVKNACTLTRKLKQDELSEFLDVIHAYLDKLPEDARLAEQESRTQIIVWRNIDSGSIDARQLAANVSQWLLDFLSIHILPLEDTSFWDIWYTGTRPFPSESVNPSIRSSLVAGLLRPHDFADIAGEDTTFAGDAPALWELPDTSILFKRYLDSGRMINVYDWFESFKVVLDTQRSELRSANEGTKTPSPKKRGKGKKQPGETEEEIEKWNVEVQARFIRALHELDYLGFIKHTTRKADHVLRTTFDIGDAD
ncbi:origin recognition complex subunit 3 N-terminus-domain-containing protein [Panaeolus papilionaceus]|nr:origin recognition complex subunit 3 N-terminus-domain-containing protein [Panaeolus papilionaceus]